MAPISEEGKKERDGYLLVGEWVDYQSGKTYPAGWHHIAVGNIEAIILVHSGSIIPHMQVAQSTKDLDRSKIELKVYSQSAQAQGLFCLPSDNALQTLIAVKKGKEWTSSSAKGKVQFSLIPAFK